jgi:hypothetical protein
MTGWGQSGLLAGAAGHDYNYIGLSGALWYGGGKDRAPRAPLTLKDRIRHQSEDHRDVVGPRDARLQHRGRHGDQQVTRRRDGGINDAVRGGDVSLGAANEMS